LNNTYITLQKEIYEEQIIRRIYTNQDKFEYLSEKNPLLLELKERLGLEIDA
jgi:DNA polymerase III subunit gamma/tau